MADFDFKALSRNDQGVLGAGVLAFIASFLPYYGASGDFLGHHASTSTSAWHSWNTLGLLMILAATALAAIMVASPEVLPRTNVSWGVVLLGLSGLGTLLVIIRSFTLDHGDVGGFSYGLRWGAYALMILGVVQTVFAFLRLQASGDPMPWASGASAPPPAA